MVYIQNIGNKEKRLSDLENNQEVVLENILDEVSEEDVKEEIENTGSTLEGYQEYLNNEFKQNAHDFIYKCGLLSKTLYKDNPSEFIIKVNTQMNQVKEELSEILEAIDLNDQEHMDGHVDSMFVVLNFLEMNKYLPQIEEPLLESQLNINKLQLIGNIFDHIIAYPLPACATDENMIIAAKRIVENNKLKYTDDYEVARNWRIPVGGRKDHIKLQAVDVDGVIYYSLVDKNGKIRKHRDFVAVDLSDLVTGE